jgi:2-amino-4-hydroxy-6-hydroxymethyldihydropteridine diphosphokinase
MDIWTTEAVFMNQAYILIGGNTGNRVNNLARACRMLEERCGRITARSSLYETQAWGITDQRDFLNQALVLETGLQAPELMDVILEVEEDMGRTRGERNGPRNIDMDILLFNDDVTDTSRLKIPHPRMHLRRFVLVPLCELAPDHRHPVSGKKISRLLKECRDPLVVERYTPGVKKKR